MAESPKSEDPKTEENLKAAGQRRVNIIWEVTQAIIALQVISTGMYVAACLALGSDATDSNRLMATTAFLLISNTVFLVIGFYFGRTNHTRTGGIGGESAGSR